MKLNARDAAAFVKAPPKETPGALIYGQDPMRVADRRQTLVLSLGGKTADEEMRLTRLTGAELRGEKSLLADAMKAQGFFPGPRVALLEDATAHNADQIVAALADCTTATAQPACVDGSPLCSAPSRRSRSICCCEGAAMLARLRPALRGEHMRWRGQSSTT